MRIRKHQQSAGEFQMAPMIDMVFLLLVFFMCVSSLSQASRKIPLELPDASMSKVPEDLSDRGTISIMNEGEFFVGGVGISLIEFKANLKHELDRDAGFKVMVRADKGVSFLRIKPVLQACADVGVSEVVYATYQAD